MRIQFFSSPLRAAAAAVAGSIIFWNIYQRERADTYNKLGQAQLMDKHKRDAAYEKALSEKQQKEAAAAATATSKPVAAAAKPRMSGASDYDHSGPEEDAAADGAGGAADASDVTDPASDTALVAAGGGDSDVITSPALSAINDDAAVDVDVPPALTSSGVDRYLTAAGGSRSGGIESGQLMDEIVELRTAHASVSEQQRSDRLQLSSVTSEVEHLRSEKSAAERQLQQSQSTLTELRRQIHDLESQRARFVSEERRRADASRREWHRKHGAAARVKPHANGRMAPSAAAKVLAANSSTGEVDSDSDTQTRLALIDQKRAQRLAAHYQTPASAPAAANGGAAKPPASAPGADSANVMYRTNRATEQLFARTAAARTESKRRRELRTDIRRSVHQSDRDRMIDVERRRLEHAIQRTVQPKPRQSVANTINPAVLSQTQPLAQATAEPAAATPARDAAVTSSDVKSAAPNTAAARLVIPASPTRQSEPKQVAFGRANNERLTPRASPPKPGGILATGATLNVHRTSDEFSARRSDERAGEHTELVITQFNQNAAESQAAAPAAASAQSDDPTAAAETPTPIAAAGDAVAAPATDTDADSSLHTRAVERILFETAKAATQPIATPGRASSAAGASAPASASRAVYGGTRQPRPLRSVSKPTSVESHSVLLHQQLSTLHALVQQLQSDQNVLCAEIQRLRHAQTAHAAQHKRVVAENARLKRALTEQTADYARRSGQHYAVSDSHSRPQSYAPPPPPAVATPNSARVKLVTAIRDPNGSGAIISSVVHPKQKLIHSAAGPGAAAAAAVSAVAFVATPTRTGLEAKQATGAGRSVSLRDLAAAIAPLDSDFSFSRSRGSAYAATPGSPAPAPAAAVAVIKKPSPPHPT